MVAELVEHWSRVRDIVGLNQWLTKVLGIIRIGQGLVGSVSG